MARIAYYRVSTRDQSVEAQRNALGGGFEKEEEFTDEGVSGAVLAADRPAFARMLSYIRKGDELWVYSIDRLGRDALDVQGTVKALEAKGVAVHVWKLGQITGDAGKIALAVLAQLAEIEKNRIAERCESGRAAARESLRLTGKTHRGKTKFGRDYAGNPAEVREWRRANGKSIAETAAHFGLSKSTVKRYCLDPLEAALKQT